MDVQHLAHVIIRDLHQLQEAGQANNLRAGLATWPEQASAELLARGTALSLHNPSRYSGLSCPFQAKGICPARHYLHDFCRKSTVCYSIKQVLKRRATARKQ